MILVEVAEGTAGVALNQARREWMAQVLARHRERELAEKFLSMEDVRRRRRQWGGILAAAPS
jgi:hypothetical protein